MMGKRWAALARMERVIERAKAKQSVTAKAPVQRAQRLSTNGFVIDWWTGATAVGGAAGRSSSARRGPPLLAMRSRSVFISTVTPNGGFSRKRSRERR